MAYTENELKVVCPKCHAVGKCLEKKLDGQYWIDEPHKERQILASELSK